MSLLSDASYRGFLEEHIRILPDVTAREHVTRRFEAWRQQYCAYRAIERAGELLESESNGPSMLYLRGESDLTLARMLVQRHRFDARLFRGFLVENAHGDGLKPEWLSPFPVCRVSDWQDRENTVVVTLSDDRPLRDNGRDRGNDYLDCFIDESRLSISEETRQKLAGRRTVLYVDYRKVQTLAALSEEIRRSSDFATVLLVNSSQGTNSQEFDAVIEQPLFYLWPLVFKSLTPDLFHVNVGWGTQGLPFAPFVPQEAIIDFYDLLTFVRDEALDGHHSEPLALTRSSEKTLFARFSRFIHRCSEEVSESLGRTYPGKDIISVTEYLREPLYVPEPAQRNGIIRLVYGGLLVQEGARPDDPHYQNFLQMVKYYCRGNLHLYLYPSPYLYGFGAPKGAEELVRRMGLDNVHTCLPLAENDFVREITRYDFGICLPTPEDVRPTSYGYILPSKFITYLRAGLPIVVPEDQSYIADLVRDNGIGVVYGYDDHERMPDLLNGQDIDRLKENVVRFREQFRIDRAMEKVLRLYDGAVKPGGMSLHAARSAVRRHRRVAPAKPRIEAATCSWPQLMETLKRSGFLSARRYQEVLDQEMGKVLSGKERQYVAGKFQSWFAQYRNWRCPSRLLELVAETGGAPYSLYLDNLADVDLLPPFLKALDEAGLARPAGFILADELERHKARLASSRVGSVRDAVPEGHVVIGFSGAPFPGKARDILLNDYLDRFIDLARFEGVRDVLRSQEGRPIVLYPLYREIHTIPMMAKCIRDKDRKIRCLALSPGRLIDADFDAAMVEPFLYLWPLVFRMVDPALVHLNVGWGIQALPLSPFIPDRERAVVDFYEVLSFLPDAYFEKTRNSAEQVRFAEEHFFKNYKHVMHLCSEEISTRLAQKYDHRGSIVSVTEYLQEPAYDKPPRGDREIRLVYGGCMLATTNPEDLYYQAFTKVVPYFTRGNLQLYVYNSPYVHGIVENEGLKEVIRRLGLTNIHACTPKKLDDFVREISDYDYGVTLLRPKDMQAVEYNYFMATKFLTYLRAGLPVVIDADNHYMAGLVERYNLGVVLHDRDLENLPDILNSLDLPALKQSVIEARERFSIDKGGEKVLKLYHDILQKSEDRPKCRATSVRTSHSERHASNDSAFQDMIDVMARRENRLYYRDQSARTMSSLATLARQFDPTVIVELGTLGGLSLRTWIGATKQTRIYAVDLSFQTLRETLESLPADLSRVTLLEQDILQTDFARLWSSRDRVIFFVDAHDLPNVPIMKHVLETALPHLPDGSLVVVDDLWFSEERLTQDNARGFLENRVCHEIDELQCFNGHYAPYHQGGSFLGFAEVIPLLEFVNRHGITLVHDRGGKHVLFVWKKAYLSQKQEFVGLEGNSGSVQYNPLECVPVSDRHVQTMRETAARYRQRDIRGAAENLSKALTQDPHDQGLSYGLAVCLARGGMLSQARDVLARSLNASSHPRYRRLFDDLVGRVGIPDTQAVSRSEQTHSPAAPPAPAGPQVETPSDECGVTIFAMPKAFTGHTAIIQKNAIRSWARINPAPEIILFGDEPGIREMAREVGATHVPAISRNEFGTPLVDRLFAAAQKHASHEVVAYVNADMVLFDDFVRAVQRVQGQLPSFLLIGQRWDLSLLDEIDFSGPRWRESLVRQVREHAMLHAECGLDYFVFRKGLWPQIPPFAIGRTAWDNWLVMDSHKRGIPVVDGTPFIAAVHQDHDYGHVAGGRHEAWNGMEAARNRSFAGPADHSGLTTGATWLLREDGTLVQTPPRRPRYISAAYREERSAWLLDQARRLIAAGAHQLAACKCEETLACLDGWLELRRLGCMGSESVSYDDIPGRYFAGHTLLAQCYMQMGRHDQVVAAYTRLLQNPSVPMSSAQRESIVQVRDRLAHRLDGTKQPAGPVGDSGSRSSGPVAIRPESPESLGRRPKITVITACRNVQRYLKECVDSILSQTMPDWELFLIDDGSTDDTHRMIEDYARQDARIKAHHFPDNRGPYVRRNFAIGRAASDFIVIQDADDIMSPTKLERLYHEINRDSCLAIVGSYHRTFLDAFRGVEHTEPGDLALDHATIVASCVSWRAAISHGTAIIRKTLFDAIGLYDENPFASDAFWSAKLALYAQIGAPVKMANIPEYLTFIRIHPSSQTQLLPVFDPRGRRVRYRHYCECKLRRMREKWRQQPSLDVAAELRNCTCSDFLLRFKAKIIEWESETLPARFVNDLLTGALTSFRERAYVSCVVILNGLEVMQRDIARRVRGFDLLKGMAFYASGLGERALAHLQQEVGNHDHPLAHKLIRASREEGPLMDVPGWCEQNAPGLELRLSGEERERIRVAMV